MMRSINIDHRSPEWASIYMHGTKQLLAAHLIASEIEKFSAMFLGKIE